MQCAGVSFVQKKDHDYCFPDLGDLRGSDLDEEPQAHTLLCQIWTRLIGGVYSLFQFQICEMFNLFVETQ